MRACLFLLPIVLLTICVSTLQAKIIHVPADSSTTQGGINGAVNGDTVMVHPGTYYEHDVDFLGKAITVMSTDPEDSVVVATTIIDAAYSGVGFYFQTNEDSTSILSGLTITGGLVLSGYGGGIHCYGSSPTITNCIITLNVAAYGGGIFCRDNSSPTITDNIISMNICWGGYGGGIYCYSNSSPSITGNDISENTARFGGGIYCSSNSSSTITNNIISENTAVDESWYDGEGGGIYCYLSSPIITNNTIKDNTTDRYGGGIYCAGTSAIITDNTITGNVADLWDGGGINCYFSSDTIENNTISGNTAYRGGGIFCAYSSSTINNNVITGNTGDLGGGISCFRPDSLPLMIENNIISSNNGSGIYCYDSFPIINNNTITGNTAGGWGGGGIHCTDSSAPMITNNTITENGASYGGGILSRYYSSPTIINTVLWNNNASVGKEIWVGIWHDPSTLTISYSDVEGGQDSVFVDSGCTLNWGDGMIDADPLFMNSDYHLQSGSPCIDTGDSTILDACRPPGLENERSDMGAYGGEENCGWLEVPVDLIVYSGDSLTVQKGDTLYFNTLIWNSTENPVAGEYWLSIILPNSNEIVIPENFLNYTNPLSGQVPAHGSLSLSNELYVPSAAHSGTYSLVGRIGRYPDNVIDEESFGFWVVE
jgi:parallel beta-helix repeat protein